MVKKSIQNWIVNHRKRFQEDNRSNRDAARTRLKKDRHATPKVNLTFHGNRHTFAQVTFQEA